MYFIFNYNVWNNCGPNREYLRHFVNRNIRVFGRMMNEVISAANTLGSHGHQQHVLSLNDWTSLQFDSFLSLPY